MGANGPAVKEKSAKCLCGHAHLLHLYNRGRCTGRVRMMITPKDAWPAQYRLDSDVWLNPKEAEALVAIGQKNVDKAPSYESKFRKGLKRGYFLQDCDCVLRSSLEISSVELIKP